MENIIGHEKVKIILNKIIDENKIGHAYLFFGKDGIGKKMMAIDFAKKIMSINDSEFNEADFKMVVPDGDVIKVEQIRNLIDDIYLKPTHSKKKVIIINDADKMNDNAQNALLKVLEEPPTYAVIILVTSNKEKIIKTILSRVMEIPFNALTNEELKQIVKEDIDLDYARGSVSKAMSILEGDYFKIANEIMPLIDKRDFLLINRKINEVKKSDIDIVKVLEMLKIMYYKELKENTYLSVKNIELIEQTIKDINRNANTDLALDKFIIEICRS